ncbi:putative transcriptional regulator [Opitutaceae bacterium TAV1]|nr:putative transcriptional regulator [Opitutaceae bacterium TAV1]
MKIRKLIKPNPSPQNDTTRKLVYSAILRRLMAERSLTQADIASMAGVTQSNVSLWLNDALPRADALHSLATALGVSMEFLLTGETGGQSPAIAAVPTRSGNVTEIRRLAKEARATLAALDDVLKKF